MTPTSQCPSDRSKLLLVLEDRAEEVLLDHVDGCERCQLELTELRSALSLVSPTAASTPSNRIRLGAVSYARSELGTPMRVATWWRPPLAAMLGAIVGVFAGQLAEARLTSSAPEMSTLDPWSLVLAAIWGGALFVYFSPLGSAIQSEILSVTLARVASFAIVILALPISKAVELCVAWTYGPGPVTPSAAIAGYAIMSMLYAAATTALVGRIRGDQLSWSRQCYTACLFTAMAGPLLIVQASVYPAIAGWAGVGGLACGALIGGLVGSERRS